MINSSFFIVEKVKTKSIQTFTDVITFYMKNDDIKELSILKDDFGTF